MKKLVYVLFLLSSVSANAQRIKKFNFLVGTWEMKTAKGKTVESWVATTDSLVGKSYNFNIKSDSVLTETVTIKKLDGVWYYCVTGHQKYNAGQTNFRLISSQNDTFIFENKTHDFPQRIYYQQKGNNEILAWIEGEMNGKKVKSEFPYLRKK